ncbi:hypothetical protein, partial [Paenirhodobacter sp.]|uniref:hypothetical protein n=1 Tax=Paenirhodobacter sp. TaxID=1965326 RepID=UPI003B420E0C
MLLKDASGMLELSARLGDDIGLAGARFEIIAASGEGEGNFEFRETSLADTRFEPGTTSGELTARVPLAAFGLQPGGQLSIRAVARDRNSLTGPGIGLSETRTIRIARPDDGIEIDTVPRPPAVDESLMSLRMLIRLTERLDARRPEMD